METRKVLLLNASGEALNLIPWTRALNLVFRNKVHVFEYFEGIEVRSQSQKFKVPSVIALIKYIFIPRQKQVSLSKKNLLIRDNYTCQFCGKALSHHTATVDHVVPISQKGVKDWSNVVVACKPCNAKKGNRTPAQARMPLLRKPWTPTRKLILAQHAETIGYENWKPYFEGAV